MENTLLLAQVVGRKCQLEGYTEKEKEYITGNLFRCCNCGVWNYKENLIGEDVEYCDSCYSEIWDDDDEWDE